MKDFNLRGYLSNNRLLESKDTYTETVTFDQKQKDSETKEYKEIAQAVKNAKEVADIYNMLDPEMFKFTESEFEDIFQDWWNNITSYDSIEDFSRNGYWDDVHSLYLHLRGYAEPVTQADGPENSIEEALNPEVSQKVNHFIKAMAKRYDYSEQDAVYAIQAALKQREFDDVNEAYGEEGHNLTAKYDAKHLDADGEMLPSHPDYEKMDEAEVAYDSSKPVMLKDFDFDGMLEYALTLHVGTPIETLKKVAQDFENVNYHREVAYLFDAIDMLEAGKDDEFADSLRLFKDEVEKTIESFSSRVTDSIAESKALRKLMTDEVVTSK